MLKKFIFISLLIKSSIGFCDLQVMDIIKKANEIAYYQGETGRAKVQMSIYDSQKRKRFRSFSILRKNKHNSFDQNFYVYFTNPSDINKTSFLVWKHVNSNDDRWLYLPALDLVKRIAASDSRTSFIGSHFYYEDVSGRDINKDVHKLLETTDKYYVIESIPKDSKIVEFSKYTTWVHKKTYLTTKVSYFDKNGNNYRDYNALRVKNISNFPTVVEAKMSDKNIGGYTVLSYSDVKYNLSLPDSVFTEKSLRSPMIKYLN